MSKNEYPPFLHKAICVQPRPQWVPKREAKPSRCPAKQLVGLRPCSSSRTSEVAKSAWRRTGWMSLGMEDFLVKVDKKNLGFRCFYEARFEVWGPGFYFFPLHPVLRMAIQQFVGTVLGTHGWSYLVLNHTSPSIE